MLAKQIRSLQHKLVKDAVRLRKERRYREEKGLVLVSGKKMIEELSQHLPPKALFFTEIPLPCSKGALYKVTKPVLEKITGMPSPDGHAALFPKRRLPVSISSPLLILDGVQDPGNVGTLFRTALGLGWKGIILLENTADPWGEKALRASKGAAFHMPHEEKTAVEISSLLQEKGFHTYLADTKGLSLEEALSKSPKAFALVLSREGKGLSSHDYPSPIKITLPMQPSTESYNVASAGSILLYLLRPHE